MHLNWKSKKPLNPQAILDKIESLRVSSDENKVSFSSFDFHDACASLHSLLDIPKKVAAEIDTGTLVYHALLLAAKDGKLEKSSFIDNLNNLIRSMLGTHNNDYRLLTAISLGKPLPFRRLYVNGTLIRLIDGAFPKKYASRESGFCSRQSGFSISYPGYTNVIVSVKSRTVRGAFTKALDALDLMRAFLCLYSNHAAELFPTNILPVNKVRLGQVHTLHYTSGQEVPDEYWFEPNFYLSSVYLHRETSLLCKKTRTHFERLAECPYADVLTDALLRYVRALDEKDHNYSAVRLWNALEVLLSPGEPQYETIVRRCAFLFEEREYHKQILNHLKEFRNECIHNGAQSNSAKIYCYQLQYYLKRLILFLLYQDFSSIAQAHEFLDLPPDEKALLAMRARVQKAIFYRKIQP